MPQVVSRDVADDMTKMAAQAFTYVPTAVKDQVLREGLYSSKGPAAASGPDAAIARRGARTRGQWQSDIKERLKGWKPESSQGPNVLFHEPDISKLPANHPLKRWDLSRIDVDLDAILKRRAKSTRVHGSELVPYSKADYEADPAGYPHRRHHDLTPDEIKAIAARSPADIWSKFNDDGRGLYAGNVPHASIITRGGVILPRYLKEASDALGELQAGRGGHLDPAATRVFAAVLLGQPGGPAAEKRAERQDLYNPVPQLRWQDDVLREYDRDAHGGRPADPVGVLQPAHASDLREGLQGDLRGGGPATKLAALLKLALTPEEIAANQRAVDEQQAARDAANPSWGQRATSLGTSLGQKALVIPQTAGNVLTRFGNMLQGGMYAGVGSGLGRLGDAAQAGGAIGERLGIPGADQLSAGGKAFGDSGWGPWPAWADIRDYGTKWTCPRATSTR